jgi:hypothetical protein
MLDSAIVECQGTMRAEVCRMSFGSLWRNGECGMADGLHILSSRL